MGLTAQEVIDFEKYYHQARQALIVSIQKGDSQEILIKHLSDLQYYAKKLSMHFGEKSEPVKKMFQELLIRISQSNGSKTNYQNIVAQMDKFLHNSRSYQNSWQIARSRLVMLMDKTKNASSVNVIRAQLFHWYYYGHNMSSSIIVWSNTSRPIINKTGAVAASAIAMQQATGLSIAESASLASTATQNVAKNYIGRHVALSASAEIAALLGVILVTTESTHYLFNDMLHEFSVNNGLSLDLSLFTMSPLETYYHIQNFGQEITQNNIVVYKTKKLSFTSEGVAKYDGVPTIIFQESCLSEQSQGDTFYQKDVGDIKSTFHENYDLRFMNLKIYKNLSKARIFQPHTEKSLDLPFNLPFQKDTPLQHTAYNH